MTRQAVAILLEGQFERKDTTFNFPTVSQLVQTSSSQQDQIGEQIQSVLVRTLLFWGPRNDVLTNRNYVVKEENSKSSKTHTFQK